MKKTKIFSCVFAVITMMLLFIMSASAAEKTYTSGNYKYTVTDGEATIVEYTSTKSTDLIIPKTLGGYPVTEIGYSAFYKTKLNSITLPSTLKKIGDLAFDGSKIKKVTFNDGLEYIGFRAFWECDELTEIVLPDSVTEVGKGAFSYCDNLKTVTLSNNLTSISQGMFYDSIKLEAIVIPDSVKTIEMNAFYGCYGIQSVKLGKNVESIGDYAFYHCRMRTVALPDGLKTVGSCAFDDCSLLEHVSMGTSIESIGYNAFDNHCTNIHYEGTYEQFWSTIEIEGWVPCMYYDHKHAYSNYVSDNNATYKADGTKTAVCDNGCYKTDTVADEGSIKPLAVTSKLTATSAVSSVTLKWNAVEGAGGYRVFVKNTATGKWDIAVRTTGKKTTATVEGLEPCKKYTFAVRAYVNNGSIVWAPKYKSISAVTKPGVADKVTSASTENSVTLNWSKVPGAAGYRVYIFKNGDWKALKTTTGLTYTATGLTAGTKYTFAVKAYTKFGGVTYWASSYKKLEAATIPSATKAVIASKISSEYVILNWDAVKGATGYRVYLWNTQTKQWDTVVRATTKQTATVKSLIPGKNYIFAVKAYIKAESGYVWAEKYTQLKVKTGALTDDYVRRMFIKANDLEEKWHIFNYIFEDEINGYADLRYRHVLDRNDYIDVYKPEFGFTFRFYAVIDDDIKSTEELRKEMLQYFTEEHTEDFIESSGFGYRDYNGKMYMHNGDGGGLFQPEAPYKDSLKKISSTEYLYRLYSSKENMYINYKVVYEKGRWVFGDEYGLFFPIWYPEKNIYD